MLCVVLALCAATSHAARPARSTQRPVARRGVLGSAAAAALLPSAARAAKLADVAPPTTRPEAGRVFAEAILPPVPFARATYRYDLGRGAYDRPRGYSHTRRCRGSDVEVNRGSAAAATWISLW